MLHNKIPSQNLPDNLPCSDYADTIGYRIPLHCHAFSNGILCRFLQTVLPVRSEKKTSLLRKLDEKKKECAERDAKQQAVKKKRNYDMSL